MITTTTTSECVCQECGSMNCLAHWYEGDIFGQCGDCASYDTLWVTHSTPAKAADPVPTLS